MSNKAEEILNDILENKETITVSLSLALSIIKYGSEMLNVVMDKGLSEEELKELATVYGASLDKAIDDMDQAVADQAARKDSTT